MKITLSMFEVGQYQDYTDLNVSHGSVSSLCNNSTAKPHLIKIRCYILACILVYVRSARLQHLYFNQIATKPDVS